MSRKSSTAAAPKAAITDSAAAVPVPASSTVQTIREVPGADAGSSGQDAHLNSDKGAADAALGDDGDVEGLWITAVPEQGFRRCGYRFTREGFGIALDALTAEQIEQLENEPNLKVERGIFGGRVEVQ